MQKCQKKKKSKSEEKKDESKWNPKFKMTIWINGLPQEKTSNDHGNDDEKWQLWVRRRKEKENREKENFHVVHRSSVICHFCIFIS